MIENSNTIEYDYKKEGFSENIFLGVLSNKISLPDLIKQSGLSRQRIYLLRNSNINSYKETPEYMFIEKNILQDTIDITTTTIIPLVPFDILIKEYLKVTEKTKVMVEKTLFIAYLIFKYENKKNLFESKINDNVWLCGMPIKEINQTIYSTLQDMGTDEIILAFRANNFNVSMDFVSAYVDEYINISKIIEVSHWTRERMSLYQYPIFKEDLFSYAEKKGYTKKQIYNVFNTNYPNEYINLGTKICLKSVFFDTYIDMSVAKELVEKSIQICKEYDIKKTDANWIFLKIKEEHPAFKFCYDNWEIKAILCETEWFKKDIKLNLVYLDNINLDKPESIEEYIYSILEEYDKLPLSFSSIYEKLKEKGRNCSLTTLASTIMPNCSQITKLEYGWILIKYLDKSTEYINELKSVKNKDIIDELKRQFNVNNIRELAKVMKGNCLSVLMQSGSDEEKKGLLLSKIAEQKDYVSIDNIKNFNLFLLQAEKICKEFNINATTVSWIIKEIQSSFPEIKIPKDENFIRLALLDRSDSFKRIDKNKMKYTKYTHN